MFPGRADSDSPSGAVSRIGVFWPRFLVFDLVLGIKSAIVFISFLLRKLLLEQSEETEDVLCGKLKPRMLDWLCKSMDPVSKQIKYEYRLRTDFISAK